MKYARTLKGVTAFKEGEIVAIFYKSSSFFLSQLVGDSWEVSPITDSENYPGHSFCSTLSTDGGVYVDGGEGSVVIVQQSISLRDIPSKK